MTTVLDTELKTFEDHKDELLADNEGKFVLIHGQKIEGTFESQQDAINIGYRLFGNVPFLVRRIVRLEVPVNILTPFTSG